MTATDPRPALAAMLAEKLAPAAAALAEAYAQDMGAAPPPEDDRALADRPPRRTRRALPSAPAPQPSSTGAAARMPEPEPAVVEEPAEDLDDWVPEPEPETGYDGSEDEYHYFDEVYVGSQQTPEFRAWHAEQERRFGPLVPDEDSYDGSEDYYNFGERQYVGKLTTPAFYDWLARQERREAAELAATEAAEGGGGCGVQWTGRVEIGPYRLPVPPACGGNRPHPACLAPSLACSFLLLPRLREAGWGPPGEPAPDPDPGGTSRASPAACAGVQAAPHPTLSRGERAFLRRRRSILPAPIPPSLAREGLGREAVFPHDGLCRASPAGGEGSQPHG